jgi:hypothetical protein
MIKSIKQQYIDLKEGKMTQHNFMRNVRMTMPQYITNVTSYNDSIKILKNKGILTEADIKITSELAKGIKVEMEHTSDPEVAKKIAMDHLAENPNYYSDLEKSGVDTPQGLQTTTGTTLEPNLNRANPRDGFSLGFFEENQEELSPRMKHIQKSMGDMTRPPITPERAKELKAKLDAERERRKKSGLQEVKVTIYGTDKAMKMLKSELKNNNVVFETDGNKVNVEDSPKVKMAVKMVKERVGMQSIKLSESVRLKEAKDEKGKWTNANGKSMYDQFKEIDNLNAQEVLIGLDWEMEKNPELSKKDAVKTVIKNLKKNPIYYTMTDLAGKEGAEAEYLGGKSANAEARHMQPYAADKVVDKKMGIQPVKGIEKPKKDADARKETNKIEKGVEELTFIAKTVRGVQKMEGTGETMKKIAMKEAVDKALAKERLKEMIRQELKEITGAYGGDDVDGEDGSSYLEEEAKINTTDVFDIHPLTGAPIKGVKFTDATHYYLVNDPKKTEKVKPENARVEISK